MVGDTKGRTGEGFALGLLFGVFGLVTVAAMPPSNARRQMWASEANGRLAGYLRSEARVIDETRIRAAQEAMRQDDTLTGSYGADTGRRLAEAADSILAQEERKALWESAMVRIDAEKRAAQDAEAKQRATASDAQPTRGTADPLKGWLIGALVLASIALVGLVALLIRML
jgi:hypothetical protein